MFRNKELRGYVGAATVFAMVMGLLLFLAFSCKYLSEGAKPR